MRKPAAWRCVFVTVAATAVLAGCAVAPADQYSASGPAATSLLQAVSSAAPGSTTASSTPTDPSSPTVPPITASTSSPTSPIAPTDPLAAQAAANRQAATAEAQKLLDSVNLPPGSKTATHPPAIWPAMGRPSATSLIDLTKYYENPMSRAEFMTWEQQHPPAGTRFSGGQGTGQTAPPWAGLFWEPTGGTPENAFNEAQVGVTSVVSGSGTVVRVDAMAIWLDPHPLPDVVNKPEHRLSLTVKGGCPASDAGMAGVDAPHAPTTALLPPGAPTAGLICVYYGMNGKRFRLYKTVKLDAAAAAKLAAKVRAIPLSHSLGAVYSCPMDDAAADFVALTYPDGSTSPLYRKTNGCWTLANGRIEAFMADLTGLKLPAGPPLTY